ncbi:MAG TPA: tRNA guanosine(34) transglycosylase Tgt [Phycisphaerae bacterium]|nr:tRNA guanosine(34) transglycosylase Tgt [Phycisphaerae bacterium]
MFTIHHRDPHTRARLGTVSTPHGSFDTPAFMAVGTRGSIKGVAPQQARDCGCQIILGNTYHLLLRPGPETVRQLGALQKFSAWNGPMLTDSGGYQVFSLSDLRSFDTGNMGGGDGVTFRSHIDGQIIRLTPEESMRVQHLLGADIIMAFDDCPPADCPPDRLAESLDRTHRWAKRCKDAHTRFSNNPAQLTPNDRLPITNYHAPALFGIVQGGTNLDARKHSAETLAALDLPGYALGGLAVGEGHDRMVDTIEHTAPLLPDEKPRYLMGVGYAKDILEAVKRGIDMFDCVLPTRNGRNALAFTYQGTRRLRNAKYALDNRPLEENCDCYCCTHFSRGYLRHLFSVEEMLGPTLLSIHNLRFFQRWMSDIRTAIKAATLHTLTAPPNDIVEE